MLNRLILYFMIICLAGVQSNAVTKSKNLQGGWRFEETASSANDLAGNSNTGSLQNSPTRTTGKFGKGISFNGSNEHVSIPHSSSLNITGQITIAAWINVSSFPSAGNYAAIVNKGYSNPPHSEAYHLRLYGTNLQTGSWNGSTDFMAQYSVAGWSTGQWHHVVGMYNGTQWVIYTDGVQRVATAAGTGAIATTATLNIAAYSNAGAISKYFNGVIDEVRIYNRALSAAEVRSLMLGYEPGEY